MIDLIKIIPYAKELVPHFKALNLAWLQKYFVVEPLDEVILSNPEAYFNDKGGLIFFATYNGEVAGTFALLKVSDNIFELSKMAVNEKFQGKGIGNAILEFCLQQAKQMQLEKLILYSNTLLYPAIHLYKKYGFIEVIDFKSQYIRANIKMEIAIK